jgi:hypothetical protein
MRAGKIDRGPRHPQRAAADEPRDPWWLRCLKFGCVVVVPAIVLGIGFLFGYYFVAGRRGGVYLTRDDTEAFMKFRFWLGAFIGGSIGLIYVVRCIVRKVDP